jgi:NAD(P)-dependent dehydrogenase (short-subunit alcohol dehydrogenase family)
LITGAASGIGRETARLFASRGWRVGLADRDAGGVERLAGQIGEAGVPLACEVTDPLCVRRTLETFTGPSNGRLDVLVNNAGILHLGAFEEMPMEAHRELIDVNVTGFTEVLHGAFGALKAAGGAVVNLASASAEYGTPEFATYSATKFYVRGLSEALDVEWRRHGIRVSYVMPAFVATAMIEGRHTASMERLGVSLNAADVAEVIWRAAHRRRLVWRVGTSFRMIRLVLAPMPVELKRRIMRWVSGY